MYEFGSPANWDASPGEHNLIDLAKHLAQKYKNSIRLLQCR